MSNVKNLDVRHRSIRRNDDQFSAEHRRHQLPLEPYRQDDSGSYCGTGGDHRPSDPPPRWRPPPERSRLLIGNYCAVSDDSSDESR